MRELCAENAQDDVWVKRKMMFGYKIKAMRKRMRKMMFEYKIKAMCIGCISYVQENVQDDVWL